MSKYDIYTNNNAYMKGECLLIIGDVENGEYEVHACTETKALAIITQFIDDYLEEEITIGGDYAGYADYPNLVAMIDYIFEPDGYITDWSMAADYFSNFVASNWWFRVIDQDSQVIFEYID